MSLKKSDLFRKFFFQKFDLLAQMFGFFFECACVVDAHLVHPLDIEDEHQLKADDAGQYEKESYENVGKHGVVLL